MQGDTLSVVEAATRLGVIDKSVRPWVKAGRLSAELVSGPYGQQYRIPADALQTAQQALAVVTVERGSDPQALALAIAQALEPRDAALRAEVETLRGELGAVRTLIEERLPLSVQGPHQGGETPEPAPGPFPSSGPPTPTAVPWWRRRWPSLAGVGVALAVLAVLLLVAMVVPVWLW